MLLTVVEGNLASKHDIELVRRDMMEMESRTEVRFKELDAKIELVRRDISESEGRTEVRLKELESRTEVRLKELDAKIELVRHESKEMESRLLDKIELVRRDIIIWLGGLIIVATTARGMLMKLLQPPIG